MFGIGGDVGQRYRQQQADALAQQLQQQALAERIRQFDAEQGLQREKLSLDREQAQAAAEREAQQLRAMNNRTGVEEMRLQGEAMDRDARDQQLGALESDPSQPEQVRKLIPLIRSGLMKGIPEDVVAPKPTRDPIADHLAMKKIDAQFQKPEKPERDPIADYEAKKKIDALYDSGGSSKAQAQQEASHAQTIEHSQSIIRKVDALLPRIGSMTAGPGGRLIGMLPGTPARDVQADLNSLAANVAFDQLQKMREASKTGGALGQVSDKEGQLLQNVIASIQQDQSPANLKKNLLEVKASAQRYLDAVQQTGGIEPMRPAMGHGGAQPADPLGIRRPQ